MIVCDGPLSGADAVDEGACGCGRGVFAFFDLNGSAGAAVRHLVRGAVGGAGDYGAVAGFCDLGYFSWLVKEGCVLTCQGKRALGSVEPELVAHFCVVG